MFLFNLLNVFYILANVRRYKTYNSHIEPKTFMVAYFCHQLSDNSVDVFFYVVLSNLYVVLSLIHLQENISWKRVLVQLAAIT